MHSTGRVKTQFLKYHFMIKWMPYIAYCKKMLNTKLFLNHEPLKSVTYTKKFVFKAAKIQIVNFCRFEIKNVNVLVEHSLFYAKTIWFLIHRFMCNIIHIVPIKHWHVSYKIPSHKLLLWKVYFWVKKAMFCVVNLFNPLIASVAVV